MKDGWIYKKLGDVCKIYNGNSINADYKKMHYEGRKDGYPFIGTKDVSFDGRITYDNGVRIPAEDNLKVARPGSVFICAEGGSAGRKIALVEQDVYFGNKLFCLEPKSGLVGGFLYYYLKSNVFQDQFAERLSGLIGGVSAKKFNDIGLISPSLSDQQSIVEYLDSSFAKIDAMKANAEKALDEAKALFQSSLNSLLEPKEGWIEKNLEDVAYCSLGKMLDKNKNKGNLFPYLRNANVQWGQFDLSDLQEMKFEDTEIERFSICKGDIVMCEGGEPGRCAIWTQDYPIFFQKALHRIRVTEEITSEYLYFYLEKMIRGGEIKEKYTGTTILHLTGQVLKKTKVYFPSFNEQQAIVTSLVALNAKIDQLQANYDKISAECDALKQALLKQVFE